MAWGDDSPLVDAKPYLRGYTPDEGVPTTQGTRINVPGPLAIPRSQLMQGGQGPGILPATPEEQAKLADFKRRESRGNYKAQNPDSTASGGYQIMDPTWRRWSEAAGYGGQYARAGDAPPEIQDVVALYGYRTEGSRPWAASEPGRGWGEGNVIRSGKWNVNDRAIAYEQGRSNSSVRWMSPDDYLAMTPPLEEGSSAKKRSLARSMALGDDIEAIPSLEVKRKANGLEVFDQDGRNRAALAKAEGVDLIPVAVHGDIGDAKTITGMRGGEARPFDFRPVAKVEGERPSPLTVKYPQATDAAGLAQAHQAGAQERAKVYYNEAGQPFTLEGEQPKPNSIYTGSIIPMSYNEETGERSGAWPEIIGSVVRGAVEGGRRAVGEGEAGQNPLRTLSPDTLGATMALAGVRGGAPGRSALAAPATAFSMRDLVEGSAIEGAMGRATANVGPERAALARDAVENFNLPIDRTHITENPSVKGAASALKRIPGSGGLPAERKLRRAFTREVAKTFGEDAEAITSDVLDQAKDRIGAVLEGIEGRNPVRQDTELLGDLRRIKSDASRALQDQEFGPIERNIESIKDKFRSEYGVLPGKAFGNIMHKGAPLDVLASKSNPNIAHYAQEIQDALRGAQQRNLTGDNLDAYRQARFQWKNLKTVEPLAEKSPTGEISPGLLNEAARKAFPTDGRVPLRRLGKIGKAFLQEPGTSFTSERGLTMLKLGGIGGALAAGHVMFPLHMLAGDVATIAVSRAVNQILRGRPLAARQSSLKMLGDFASAMPKTRAHLMRGLTMGTLGRLTGPLGTGQVPPPQ